MLITASSLSEPPLGLKECKQYNECEKEEEYHANNKKRQSEKQTREYESKKNTIGYVTAQLKIINKVL